MGVARVYLGRRTSGTLPSFPPLKMTILLLHWLGWDIQGTLSPCRQAGLKCTHTTVTARHIYTNAKILKASLPYQVQSQGLKMKMTFKIENDIQNSRCQYKTVKRPRLAWRKCNCEVSQHSAKPMKQQIRHFQRREGDQSTRYPAPLEQNVIFVVGEWYPRQGPLLMDND